MTDILAHALFPPLFTLGVLALMLVAFVREVYPPEVIAVIGAAALLATGMIPASALPERLRQPGPLDHRLDADPVRRSGPYRRDQQRLAADLAPRPGQPGGGDRC